MLRPVVGMYRLFATETGSFNPVNFFINFFAPFVRFAAKTLKEYVIMSEKWNKVKDAWQVEAAAVDIDSINDFVD